MRLAEWSFVDGEYRAARRAIREVLATSPVEQERAVARALRVRIQVDPAVWWATLAGALFFGGLLLWTYTR